MFGIRASKADEFRQRPLALGDKEEGKGNNSIFSTNLGPVLYEDG